MYDWVVGLKINPLLLDYISLIIHHQPTTCWPQVGCSPGQPVGERKACCSSSRQCGLLAIMTCLSLQQTAHSLDFHFGDNAINQIRTSSSCSHVSFPTSSARAVILLFSPNLTTLSRPFHFLGGAEANGQSAKPYLSLYCCWTENEPMILWIFLCILILLGIA